MEANLISDVNKKDPRIESLANRDRESDPSTIYEDPDALPDWWQDAVREFESYDLRPYRPSRFTDGEIVQDVIQTLEEKYEVSIDLRAKNPEYNGEWEIIINGKSVAKTQHQRKADGYTVYDISKNELINKLEEIN